MSDVTYFVLACIFNVFEYLYRVFDRMYEALTNKYVFVLIGVVTLAACAVMAIAVAWVSGWIS